MGTSNERSAQAGLRGPVKAALAIATGRLDRLVHHGSEAYAADLEHEAEEPGRHPTTAAVLAAVAQAVREAA